MKRRVLTLFALGLACSLSAAQSSQQRRYELRGKVSRASGGPFTDVQPHVFLQGSTTPFTAQTMADPSGHYKFKNLLAGMYTLIIAVAHEGQTQHTVDVGPSLVDGRGRLEASFVFDPKPTAGDTEVVSARELSVPEGARRLYDRAQERLGERQVPAAVELLKKAVELAPQFSAAWNNLGTIAYQTQDYKQAEHYFRKALEQEPGSYPPLVNLGGALLSQGRPQDALPVNVRAVKARPGDALAHSQLGQSYYFVGQFELAETHLKQAKALDPSHFSFPQLLLAQIYERKQNYPAVVAELEEFLKLHPDSGLAPAVAESLQRVRARLH